MTYGDQLIRNVSYILLIGLIATSLSFAWAPKEIIEIQNTIDVSGEATLSAPTEQVEIFVTAETQQALAKDSQQENARIIQQAIAALTGAGVPRASIETVMFDLQPVYEFDDILEKTVLTGYRTTHSLRVKLSDPSKSGDVIDTAVQAGINRIDRIVFDITDERKEELRKQALAQASAKAKSKAQELAASQGVKMVGVAKVSEGTVIILPFERVFAAASAGGTEILPGQVQVSATVSASYLIG
jgi:hypothetical protein